MKSNNHTKGTWAIRDLEIIGPIGSNKSICEMTGDFMTTEESHANAARIVKCVNNHDRLLEALKEAVNELEIFVGDESLLLDPKDPQSNPRATAYHKGLAAIKEATK